MLDRPLVEGNRPVRVVLAYRRADEKAARQLDIHGNFVANIQLVGKTALVIGIVNYIIVQAAVGGHGVCVLPAVQVCQHKDVGAVRFLQLVVGDMLNDHIRLLVADDFPRFDNENLRVQLILGKHKRGDALQNGGNRGAGQASFLHQLAHKVVAHIAQCHAVSGVLIVVSFDKRLPLLKLLAGGQLGGLLAVFGFDILISFRESVLPPLPPYVTFITVERTASI